MLKSMISNFSLKINAVQIPLILFILSVSIKYLLFYKVSGPTLFFDEFYYKEFAQSLYMNLQYASTQYPLFYPLSISFSFLFEDFYSIIKLLNFIYSSSIVFPVWLISRMFLDKEKSTFCTFLSVLIPFHFILPGMVMSENIYFPLFLFAVYIVLKIPNSREYTWAFITGLLFGLLHLTRHISIVVIPILMLVWIFKPISGYENGVEYNEKIYIKKKKKQLMIVLSSYLLTYFPWLYMGLKNNYDILSIIGMGISGIGESQITLSYQDLIMWTSFYAAYLVLMNFPILNLVMFSPYLVFSRRITDSLSRLVLLTNGVAITLSLAAIRHSWRASYNYPEPLRINGRYVTYVSVLFLIIAFIVIDKIEKKEINSKSLFLVLGLVFPLSFGILSFEVLINGNIWKIPDFFMINFNALDSYIYKLLGFKSLVMVIILFFIITILFFKQKKWIKYNVFFGLIIFYMLANTYFYQDVTRFQSDSVHGKVLAETIKEDINNLNQNEYTVFTDIKLNSNPDPKTFFDFSLRFWGNNNNFNIENISLKNVEALTTKDGYFLSSKNYFNEVQELTRYKVQDKIFRVYKLPLKSDLKNNISYIDFSHGDYELVDGLYSLENGYRWSSKTSEFILERNMESFLFFNLWFADMGKYTVNSLELTASLDDEILQKIKITDSGQFKHYIKLPANYSKKGLAVVRLTLNSELVKDKGTKDKRDLAFVVSEIGFKNKINY